MKILELNNTVTEISLKALNTWMAMTEESQWTWKWINRNHLIWWTENRNIGENNMDRGSGAYGMIPKGLTLFHWSSQKRKIGAENMFEEIILENFPNLVTEISL